MIPFAVPLALKALPWRYIALGAGALVVVGTVWWQIDSYGDRREQAGRDDIQQAWDKDAAERLQAYTALQADYRAKEQTLSRQVGEIQQEKTDELARIAARYQRDLNGLRNRPTKRASVPDPSTTSPDGIGGTGAGLAKPDATFLAGYSADVQQLQSRYDACVKQYGAARKSLEIGSTVVGQ